MDHPCSQAGPSRLAPWHSGGALRRHGHCENQGQRRDDRRAGASTPRRRQTAHRSLLSVEPSRSTPPPPPSSLLISRPIKELSSSLSSSSSSLLVTSHSRASSPSSPSSLPPPPSSFSPAPSSSSSPPSSAAAARPRRPSRHVSQAASLIIASSIFLVDTQLFSHAAAAPSPRDVKGKGRALDELDDQSEWFARDAVLHQPRTPLLLTVGPQGVPIAGRRNSPPQGPPPQSAGAPPPTHTIYRKSLWNSETWLHDHDLATSSDGTLVAKWTEQGRGIWFQKKAVIIVSCFLAIFIILVIGAAGFVRDRKVGDKEAAETGDEDFDLSDEALLKRIREKHEAQIAANGGESGTGDGGDETLSGKEKRKRRAKAEKKRLALERSGTSSGSSTAVSRRIVSRWMRMPGRVYSDNSSRETLGQQSPPKANSDSMSIRSNRSARNRLGERLGSPRSERVVVEYSRSSQHGQSSGSDGDRSSPLPRSLSQDADSSQQSMNGRGALDAGDFTAAERAEDMLATLPPAYIAASAAGSSQRAASSSTAPGSHQRPLAGATMAAASDVKGIDREEIAAATAASLGVSDEIVRAIHMSNGGSSIETSDEDAQSGHIATDDKTRLAALAAAASQPASRPSAPLYTSQQGGSFNPAASAPSVNSHSLEPSAPSLAVDQDGFEQLSDGDEDSSPGFAPIAFRTNGHLSPSSSSGTPRYMGSYSREHAPHMHLVDRKDKGKGPLLPNPPRPHAQAFSPFDRPYQLSFAPGSIGSDHSGFSSQSQAPLLRSSSTKSVPSTNSVRSSSEAHGSNGVNGVSEKQREAEAEAEAYRRLASAASAPGVNVNGANGGDGTAFLPSYETAKQSQRPQQQQLAPSAPGVEDLFGIADATPAAPSAPPVIRLTDEEQRPSAPPADLDDESTEI